MRALGMDAFPSVRADMQRDFVVEPDPRRPGSPFIFHGDGEPRPAALYRFAWKFTQPNCAFKTTPSTLSFSSGNAAHTFLRSHRLWE
jgi:hypothetical protein